MLLEERPRREFSHKIKMFGFGMENANKIGMTAYEVIEILRESNLWPPLTKEEKQDVIRHVFRTYREKSAESKVIIKEE